MTDLTPDLTQLDCAGDRDYTAAMADGLACVVCGLCFVCYPRRAPREVGLDADNGCPVFACAECCGETDHRFGKCCGEA